MKKETFTIVCKRIGKNLVFMLIVLGMLKVGAIEAVRILVRKEGACYYFQTCLECCYCMLFKPVIMIGKIGEIWVI